MFSLDEAFFATSSYLEQKDIYWRALSLALGVFTVVEFVRSQVPEIEVLQLIPGLYLLLLFSSWIFLVFFSNLLQRIPFEIDNRKSCGTKTLDKIELGTISTASVGIAFFQIWVNLNTVIPIGLDSFNSYGEKTLENIWSLDDVISLESYFLFIVVILSQIPILILLNPSSENYALVLPGIWRAVGTICFIIGGIVTPTIDVITQISFAGSTFCLYVLLISIVAKRLNLKYREGAIFG
jgi:hypothetical protein